MSDEEMDYETALDRLLIRDPRYLREAYLFVQRSLSYYREAHEDDRESPHISGQELLTGVRELALAEFGPMARGVLNHWGLRRGEDVGQIVFNLIEAGLMSKTDNDRIEDFSGVMVFDESLDQEFSW